MLEITHAYAQYHMNYHNVGPRWQGVCSGDLCDLTTFSRFVWITFFNAYKLYHFKFIYEMAFDLTRGAFKVAETSPIESNWVWWRHWIHFLSGSCDEFGAKLTIFPRKSKNIFAISSATYFATFWSLWCSAHNSFRNRFKHK